MGFGNIPNHRVNSPTIIARDGDSDSHPGIAESEDKSFLRPPLHFDGFPSPPSSIARADDSDSSHPYITASEGVSFLAPPSHHGDLLALPLNGHGESSFIDESSFVVPKTLANPLLIDTDGAEQAALNPAVLNDYVMRVKGVIAKSAPDVFPQVDTAFEPVSAMLTRQQGPVLDGNNQQDQLKIYAACKKVENITNRSNAPEAVKLVASEFKRAVGSAIAQSVAATKLGDEKITAPRVGQMEADVSTTALKIGGGQNVAIGRATGGVALKGVKQVSSTGIDNTLLDLRGKGLAAYGSVSLGPTESMVSDKKMRLMPGAGFEGEIGHERHEGQQIFPQYQKMIELRNELTGPRAYPNKEPDKGLGTYDRVTMGVTDCTDTVAGCWGAFPKVGQLAKRLIQAVSWTPSKAGVSFDMQRLGTTERSGSVVDLEEALRKAGDQTSALQNKVHEAGDIDEFKTSDARPPAVLANVAISKTGMSVSVGGRTPAIGFGGGINLDRTQVDYYHFNEAVSVKTVAAAIAKSTAPGAMVLSGNTCPGSLPEDLKECGGIIEREVGEMREYRRKFEKSNFQEHKDRTADITDQYYRNEFAGLYEEDSFKKVCGEDRDALPMLVFAKRSLEFEKQNVADEENPNVDEKTKLDNQTERNRQLMYYAENCFSGATSADEGGTEFVARQVVMKSNHENQRAIKYTNGQLAGNVGFFSGADSIVKQNGIEKSPEDPTGLATLATRPVVFNLDGRPGVSLGIQVTEQHPNIIKNGIAVQFKATVDGAPAAVIRDASALLGAVKDPNKLKQAIKDQCPEGVNMESVSAGMKKGMEEAALLLGSAAVVGVPRGSVQGDYGQGELSANLVKANVGGEIGISFNLTTNRMDSVVVTGKTQASGKVADLGTAPSTKTPDTANQFDGTANIGHATANSKYVPLSTAAHIGTLGQLLNKITPSCDDEEYENIARNHDLVGSNFVRGGSRGNYAQAIFDLNRDIRSENRKNEGYGALIQKHIPEKFDETAAKIGNAIDRHFPELGDESARQVVENFNAHVDRLKGGDSSREARHDTEAGFVADQSVSQQRRDYLRVMKCWVDVRAVHAGACTEYRNTGLQLTSHVSPRLASMFEKLEPKSNDS